MNAFTQAAVQPSFQASQQDAPYSGDMLITLTDDGVCIYQELDTLVLDME